VPLPAEGFRELLSCCLSIIRGKAKELDCLYLIRQAHDERLFVPDAYDWITSPDWLPSYQIFCDCLMEELAQQDGISVDEAPGEVKGAFWSYLARALTGKWEQRYAPNGPWLRYRRGRRSGVCRSSGGHGAKGKLSSQVKNTNCRFPPYSVTPRRTTPISCRSTGRLRLSLLC
jgi:hypothetical protein